jgi:hypothetical protein
LDEEIQALFGEERNDDGGANEKYIEYREYIEKVNSRAMDERKKRKLEMKEFWSKKHGMAGGEDASRF